MSLEYVYKFLPIVPDMKIMRFNRIYLSPKVGNYKETQGVKVPFYLQFCLNIF